MVGIEKAKTHKYIDIIQ